jgi:hypothetical protein
MRIVVCGLVIAALAVAGADAAGPTMPGFPTASTKVTSGVWDGLHWTLYAGETVTPTWFAHCLRFVVASTHRGGGGCGGGGLRHPGELLPSSPPAPGFGYGISFTAASVCPSFYDFAGLVLADAREIVMRLSSGPTVRVRTLASPAGFAGSLRFWVAPVPCDANVTSLVARDGRGRVVGRIESRFLPRTAH